MMRNVERPSPPQREEFNAFTLITSRWADNDIYGHINNAVYYFYFDTAVNQYLIEQDALDIYAGEVIGLVVNSLCDYFAPLAFPDQIHAGVKVAHIGSSSVRYQIALFRNDETEASAAGSFTHVYVDRATRRPTHLPDKLSAALQAIIASD